MTTPPLGHTEGKQVGVLEDTEGVSSQLYEFTISWQGHKDLPKRELLYLTTVSRQVLMKACGAITYITARVKHLEL